MSKRELQRQKRRLVQAVRQLNARGSSPDNRTATDLIQGLQQAAKAGELVLVLGAGVSMASGLPDWTTLLQRLLLQTGNTNLEITPNEAVTLQRIFEEIFRPSPLVTARHLAHHFRSKDKNGELEFLRALRGALYTDYSSASASPLLEAIADLAAAGRGVLSAVVTYNYDDLLERRLASHPKRPKFRSVTGRDISVPT
jgi:hypothetical protein